MQLSDLIINTRLRSPWSALDLGLLIAKKYWLLYVSVWLIVATPIFLVLMFSLEQQYFWIVMTVIWWLKPLFERPIVYLLSQHMFAQSRSIKQVFADWKKWLLPGLFWSLTLRRFSPSRSFLMPVILLEGLKGNRYNKRVSVLSAKGGSQAFWLTTVFIHIEYFITFALLIIIANFASLNLFENIATGDYGLGFEWLFNGITLVTMAIAAPFYSASGFALYLARRIELEAWDIEICFREMAMEAFQ